MPETVKRKRTTRPPAVTTHKEIRAESFLLVDSNGAVRAHLSATKDQTVLGMFDPRGGLRLAIRVREREATVNIFDKYDGADKGRRGNFIEAIRLGYETNARGEHRPGLHVFDSEENERVSVRAVEEGGAIFVTDPEGSYSAIGDEGLTVYDADDNALAEYCAPAKESAAVEGEAQQPAPTLEQARDKMIEAMRELVGHPDASDAFIAWVNKFGSTLLRKMDEIDEALKDEADEQAKAQVVFRNFTAATADLLACDATPAPLHEAIADAITDVGNKMEANNEDADESARRVLSRIFGLSEVDKSRPA